MPAEAFVAEFAHSSTGEYTTGRTVEIHDAIRLVDDIRMEMCIRDRFTTLAPSGVVAFICMGLPVLGRGASVALRQRPNVFLGLSLIHISRHRCRV